MPPAPWTSGSTITAAISSPWKSRIASSAVGVAGRDAVLGEQQRLVGGVEEVDAAERDRSDRVAVVALGEADERGAARVLAAALAPVLEGHLQRDLGRRRARVGVEDARQPRRRDLDEPRGELGARGVGEAEHRRVGDPVELVADRRRRSSGAGGRGRCTRATRCRRCSGRPCSSIRSVPSAASIDEGLLLDPAPLLGERVPEVAVVELTLIRDSSAMEC